MPHQKEVLAINHSETWGDDYYTHIAYPVNPNNCYVVERAELLLLIPGLNPNLNLNFAPYTIEIAIDLLLKTEAPSFGEKLIDEEFAILEAAIGLCESDYKDIMDYTINAIKGILE